MTPPPTHTTRSMAGDPRRGMHNTSVSHAPLHFWYLFFFVFIFAAYFAWVCTHISTCRVCSRGIVIANDGGVTFLGACHSGIFFLFTSIGLCLSHIHGVLSRTFRKAVSVFEVSFGSDKIEYM